MIMEIFAILDAAAERYIEPFPAPTVQVAIREFQRACERQDGPFGKFPEDYTLWVIGTFDAEFGVLEGHPGRKIAMATSFVHGAQIDLVTETEAEA